MADVDSRFCVAVVIFRLSRLSKGVHGVKHHLSVKMLRLSKGMGERLTGSIETCYPHSENK